MLFLNKQTEITNNSHSVGDLVTGAFDGLTVGISVTGCIVGISLGFSVGAAAMQTVFNVSKSKNFSAK